MTIESAIKPSFSNGINKTTRGFPTLPLSVLIHSPEAYNQSLPGKQRGYLSLRYTPERRNTPDPSFSINRNGVPWQLTWSNNLTCGGDSFKVNPNEDACSRFLQGTNFPHLFSDTIIPRFRSIVPIIKTLLRKAGKSPLPEQKTQKIRLSGLWGKTLLTTALKPYRTESNPNALWVRASITSVSPKDGKITATIERCTAPDLLRAYLWEQRFPSGYYLCASSLFFPNATKELRGVKK